MGDAVVLDHADGGSLAAVLARRGRLEPGEVVTTVAPLAQALAEAHAHGLVHGHVGLGSVLLSADGRPLLDDLGLAVLRDQGEALDPSGGLAGAADVWALGALAHELLTGEPYTPGVALGSTVPTPLARTVATAVAFDATSRPDAATFASSLLAACPALPVRGVPAAPPVGPALPAHRRPGRRVLLGTVAGLAVVLGVVATGWWWGRGAVERPARVQAVTAMTQVGAVRDRNGRSRTRSFRRSFLEGFAHRIGERLRVAADIGVDGARAEVGDAALLPVLRRRDDDVAAAQREAFPHMVSRAVGPRTYHPGGWAAGTTAADIAHLGVAARALADPP